MYHDMDSPHRKMPVFQERNYDRKKELANELACAECPRPGESESMQEHRLKEVSIAKKRFAPQPGDGTVLKEHREEMLLLALLEIRYRHDEVNKDRCEWNIGARRRQTFEEDDEGFLP